MRHPAFSTITVADPNLLDALERASSEELDTARFGIVGFGRDYSIFAYNRFEQEIAGLSGDDIVGRHFFAEVAPCTDNFLVRGKFDDAWQNGRDLDTLVPYTFSYRMVATRVQLRLLVRGDRAWMVVKIHGQ